MEEASDFNVTLRDSWAAIDGVFMLEMDESAIVGMI